jgi:hypothetical protein
VHATREGSRVWNLRGAGIRRENEIRSRAGWPSPPRRARHGGGWLLDARVQAQDAKHPCRSHHVRAVAMSAPCPKDTPKDTLRRTPKASTTRAQPRRQGPKRLRARA